MKHRNHRNPKALATVRSPLVANQPQILSLSNLTAKGRRRIRALLGIKDEIPAPGFVNDARHKACQRTLQGAQRVRTLREAAQNPAAAG